MIPVLAGMGALNAGISGIQKWQEGKDQEEAAKKQALQSLNQRFMKDQRFAPVSKVPEAPSFGETVVAPMVQGAATTAANSMLSSAMRPSPAAGVAGAAGAAPDPHAEYQKGFDAKLATRKALNPAVMPSDEEQDFYLRGGR